MKELVEYILATVILASSLVAYNFIMDTMSAPPDVVVDPTLLSLLSTQIKDLLEAPVLHGNSSSPFFSFEKYLNQELGYILKDYAYRIEVVSGGITEMTYDNTSKNITIKVVEPGTLNLLLINQTPTGFTIVNTTVANYAYANGAYFYTINISSLGVGNLLYAVAVLETPSYRYIDYLPIGNVVEANFTEYNGLVAVALPSNITTDTSFNTTIVYYGNMTYEVVDSRTLIEIIEIVNETQSQGQGKGQGQGNRVTFSNETISYVLNNRDADVNNYRVYELDVVKYTNITTIKIEGNSGKYSSNSTTLSPISDPVESPIYNLLLVVFRDSSGKIYVARWYPYSLTIGSNIPGEFPYSKLSFYARLGYFDYWVTVYLWRVSI